MMSIYCLFCQDRHSSIVNYPFNMQHPTGQAGTADRCAIIDNISTLGCQAHQTQWEYWATQEGTLWSVQMSVLT